MGVVFSSMPIAALAATSKCLPTSTNIGDIFCKIGEILNSVIPILILLGVVYFVWGVITYVISKEEEAKKAGKNRIIYGIIGLAVIIAMWGLVNILVRTLGIDTTSVTTFPTVVIP